MRKHFSEHIERIAQEQEDLIFITGDLGYNALESLQQTMGSRFINAGVAEQNMVSMAAGMASLGYKVICYSIAPFVVYRCLEQIRNDVCFHQLPVFIVGNGGGYGYGIMGSSHHAIEDIGTLSGLPHMHCYIPTFLEELPLFIDQMFAEKSPAYLRLGLGNPMPADWKQYAGGHYINAREQSALTVVCQGPLMSHVIAAVDKLGWSDRISIFSCGTMPLKALDTVITDDLRGSSRLLVVEEHVAVGGLGMTLSWLLQQERLHVSQFKHLYALGYPNGLYGNQGYHQQQSGLDVANIMRSIEQLLQA